MREALHKSTGGNKSTGGHMSTGGSNSTGGLTSSSGLPNGWNVKISGLLSEIGSLNRAHVYQ